jgi:acetoin utilization protein AcuC
MCPRRAVFIHSDEIERFHYPPRSPFKTERAGMTRSILRSIDRYTGAGRSEAPPVPAASADLGLFHTRDYLEVLKQASAGTVDPARALAAGLGSEETPIFRDLHDYAVLASGGTLGGARMVLDGAVDVAFNPSGGYHHAERERAGGFCYINDIVLACSVLAGADRRVLCVDIDAHHGNGTQEAFYRTSQVLTVSLHESGHTLYPWGGFENEIGEADGRGYNVNLPVPAGTDDEAYGAAFAQIVPPLAEAYDPDVVVLEIGMDILSVDPLTHLNMTNNVLADIIRAMKRTGKPILATGGGGYHPESTARGWAVAWLELCGIDIEEDLTIGMGGVFLGTNEWQAGLRDMRVYSRGETRNETVRRLRTSVEYLKRHVFPIHGL